MAITPLPAPTPAGVVGAACSEVRSLHGSLWSAKGSDELVQTVEELQRLKAAAAALEAELVAELDARETPRRELGWGSTADWYTHVAGVSRRAGKRTVVQARALAGERAETLGALREGAVSPEQAGVVIDAVDRLPSGDLVRRRGERVLLEEAGRLNATDLHRVGRHLARVVDPDGEERAAEKDLDREERAAHLGRFLSVTDDGCGGVRLRGRGSAEDGAVLRAALLPLTRPERTADPAPCGEPADQRDHGARTWDAIVRLAQHALDSELAPASHGARPRVAVTIDHGSFHDAEGGTGTSTTEDGLVLPASAVRRMACDCELVRVLLSKDGAVLDVGRAHQLVTPAIWTALVARDQHCAFPGCTRPPVMCHAHHIVHWTDHGPTALDNLVLVCGHHHRTLHNTPWHVRLGGDGRPEFLPPPTVRHPDPQWTRHRVRRE